MLITPESLLLACKEGRIINCTIDGFDPLEVYTHKVLNLELTMIDSDPLYSFIHKTEFAEAKTVYIQMLRNEIFKRKIGITL